MGALNRRISSGGGGAIDIALNFTTNGSGEATLAGFVVAGVTLIDVWLNQTGEQGVKIPTADYSYNAGTGVITGLEASKNYTAYGR